MLKRHLCIIDLNSGVLKLGSAGASVPFLAEKDLPTSARETQARERLACVAAGLVVRLLVFFLISRAIYLTWRRAV